MLISTAFQVLSLRSALSNIHPPDSFSVDHVPYLPSLPVRSLPSRDLLCPTANPATRTKTLSRIPPQDLRVKVPAGTPL